MNYQIQDGLVLQAKWCPSPNFGPRPEGALGLVSLVVIHNISLPPGQFNGGYVEQFFQNTLNPSDHPYFAEIAHLKVSSHLFIDRHGHIIQFVNLNDRAWHAGLSYYQGRENCNDFSIGIELEGADTISYTNEQYSTLEHLLPVIMASYPLVDRTRITGHEEIAPMRKTDPGNAFDWQRLFIGLSNN